MVYPKKELNKLISRLILRVRKLIPVQKVILFGSYAHGKPRANSDLDMAIVSPVFSKLSDIKRISLLSQALRHFSLPYPIQIELFGFTEKDFADADYFDIEGEILDKGKVIYSNKARRFSAAMTSPT